MRRLFAPLALLAVLGMLYGGATPASACSCARQDAAGYVQAADTIVIGTVSGLVPDADNAGDQDARFEVQTYLRGAGPAEVIVDDPVGDGDCGFFGEPSVGREYLLFMRGGASPFTTNLCSGNAAVLPDDAASDAFVQEVKAITGEGVPPEGADGAPEGEGETPGEAPDPVPDAVVEEDGGTNADWVLVAGVAAGVALGIAMLGGAVVWRARRGS